MKHILSTIVALFVAVPAIASTNIYCTSLPNSMGQVANIESTGSLNREANSLSMVITGAPTQTYAFLTCGTSRLNVPFANGTLCINPLVNFYRVGAPVLTVNGTGASPVDLTVLPLDNTLLFQWWYRNPAAGGSMFNTSNAMECVFE